MLGIPNQSYSSYDMHIFTYHSELHGQKTLLKECKLGYARSELRNRRPKSRNIPPIYVFWSTCMPFSIVIRQCAEERLIRRFLYPNGHFSDFSGSLAVAYVSYGLYWMVRNVARLIRNGFVSNLSPFDWFGSCSDCTVTLLWSYSVRIAMNIYSSFGQLCTAGT